MPLDMFLNLVVLAAASAWTPGPNNAMVATSGALFGLRRTLPHVMGISLGYALLIFVVSLGLGELFRQSEAMRLVLRWAGAGLLLWVAWRIATAGGLSLARREPRPMTFAEAAAFQWINPKGWAFAIAVTAQYVVVGSPYLSALIIAAVYVAAGIGSATTWALAGREITRRLSGPRAQRRFNIVMGVLIAACVLLLFVDPA